MLASLLQQRILKPVAAIFPGLGLGLLALSIFFALQSWLSMRSMVHSEATVTENVATQDAKGNVFYTAHLRFRASNGEVHTFVDPVTSTDSDDPDVATGAIVPLVYPPGHPESARIATVWRVYRIAIVFLLLGIAFFDTGLVLRLVLKHRKA